MTQVGFHIGRMNYLGHFGPLIDYFRKMGVPVTLLCNHLSKPKGLKAYLFPEIDRVKEAFPEDDVQAFRTLNDFKEIVHEKSMHRVFFLTFDDVGQKAKSMLENRTKFSYVQTGMDLLLSNHLPVPDEIFIFSDPWRNWWKDWLNHVGMIEKGYQKDVIQRIKQFTWVSGFPQADQYLNLSRETICRKYDLPIDRKTVLLLSFPWGVMYDPWCHILYRPGNPLIKLFKLARYGAWGQIPKIPGAVDDLKITRAIRNFCNGNDATFVVKARLKNEVPDYIEDLADRIIFDDSYYPYTIMEVMYVSDLCIHFYSDAIKESVLCNTPSICLGPERGDDWEENAGRFYLDDFSMKSGSFYNYDGVVYNRSVERFFSEFPQSSFEDYPLHDKSKNEFIQKFLGHDDRNASEIIFQHVMKI